MNRQVVFNIIFGIFIYSIKNKLIDTDQIVSLFNHISNHFYEEMFNILFG